MDADEQAGRDPGGDPAQVRLRIEGRVQGVWYRAGAAEAARGLGLSGWVRNLPDGAVAALAEGPRAEVQRFVDWCRQGPPGARVDRVQARWGPATGEPEGFATIR